MMESYPCVICTNECQNDTIQCSNCRNWVHSNCASLNSSELKLWSVKSLKYLCRCCAFNGSDYDAEAALARLQSALSTGKRTTLSNVAKNEEKLLNTYKVHLPDAKQNQLDYDIDEVSHEILGIYHTAMKYQFKPLKIFGDGNCLYRAVSQSLTGTQNYHELLRLKTSLELIGNEHYYKECISSVIDDTRVVISGYSALTHDAVFINSYSELAHMYALSSVIEQPIKSYYPPQINSEYSSEPYTRRVVGRNVKDGPPEIWIMWTQMSVPETVTEFTPNHFVPLVTMNKENIVIDETTVNDSSYDFNVTEISLSKIPEVEVETHAANDSVSDTSERSVQSDNESHETIDDLSHESETELCSDKMGVLDSGFLETKCAVDLLVNAKVGFEKIPGGTKENKYFVIENSTNQDKRAKNKHSCFSDDCGAWDTSKGTSPKTLYFRDSQGDLSVIFFKNGKYCTKKRIQRKTEYVPMIPQPDKNQVVAIHRYYTTLKLNELYKKRVTWLGEGGLGSSYAVAEYIGKFPGLAPHGNSMKDLKEYIRTPAYVIDEVSDMIKKDKPKKIFDTLKHKYDEVTRPSGLQQIRDRKKYMSSKENPMSGPKKNVADQIIILQNMVSENDKFVRSIVRTNGKTPCIILYTDDQITDLKKLCCAGHTVLGVDKTFNLCDMHVTVTCFKQLSVVRNTTKQPPLFFGPMYIHDNSDFESYCHFFHHIKMKVIDSTLENLVIGSDDERALVKAVTTAFPEATHVLCTRHLKENSKQKLVDDAVNITDRNMILNKIFGNNGIVDADDSICFDEKCDQLQADCSSISENFVKYFRDRLRPHLKEKVNAPARNDKIDTNWTNNNCESVNHVLKQTVDWKSKPISDLVKSIHCLVEGQYKDLRSALLSTGEFRLAETHAKFQVTKTQWIDMTPDQRNRLYLRFRQHTIEKPGFQTSSDGKSTIVAPRTHGRKPGQRKRKVNAKTTSIKRTKVDK